MDNNQENETTYQEPKKNPMNKTQNTFLSTHSSRKLQQNAKYYMNSTNKSSKFLPPITPINTSMTENFSPNNGKITGRCFSLKNNLLEKAYEPNHLMQRLSDNRMDMNKKNNELTELKIKYSKLLDENKAAKKLIAKILGVKVDQSFSKQEILEKIEKCNPSASDKKNLKYIYDIIKLKLEINDKRNKIAEVNNQIEYYTKNVKTKTLTDLNNEYNLKTTHQNKIIKLVEKLEVVVNKNKTKLEEIKKQYTSKKDLSAKMKSEYGATEKELRELEEEKEKLDNIVIEIRERQRKMQDKIKVNKHKNENEEEILYKKIDLENIEQYISKREAMFKEIEDRKNNIKNLEKEKESLEEVIKELNVKNNELCIKADNYNKEGPKLIQKSYEPLNIQRNMVDLEEKLKIFRKEYELTKKKHEEKQVELQEELDLLNTEVEENGKVIDKNNEEKNKLKGEIDELNNKIENLKKEINEKEKKIKVTKSEIEDFEKNEEIKKKVAEEKERVENEINRKKEEMKKKEDMYKEKQYKRDIDLLKKNVDKLTSENKSIEEENERLKKEIEEFSETINQCAELEEKLKEGQEE